MARKAALACPLAWPLRPSSSGPNTSAPRRVCSALVVRSRHVILVVGRAPPPSPVALPFCLMMVLLRGSWAARCGAALVALALRHEDPRVVSPPCQAARALPALLGCLAAGYRAHTARSYLVRTPPCWPSFLGWARRALGVYRSRHERVLSRSHVSVARIIASRQNLRLHVAQT